MKQRVKLAQAIVHDPKVIFLDEPTNGLDPAGRDEMLALVRRIGVEFGISIVFCTHLLGEIERVCDHLVVIDAGRLVRSAPLEEFTRTVGTLRVEVDGHAEPVLQRLAGVGLSVAADGERFLDVSFDGVAPLDAIRDAVVEAGLGLIRIEQRRHSLEELFRTTAAETEREAVGA
jgi:ABC-2 type transport system ATP-binding protein